MGHMPLVMIRFRNAVVVLASLVSAGIYIYVGRLLTNGSSYTCPMQPCSSPCRIPTGRSCSWWLSCVRSIGPVVLIVVCAYVWMDPDRRAMWVAFVVILLTGLIVADAPASVWHRFAPA
jgi:hypothetical protein